jgi:myosin-5
MPRFEATNLQRGHKHFTLVHYGVPVTYEMDGFVEKNKDDIPCGASKLLKSSSKDFVKFLGMMMDDSAEASGGASDSDSPRASAKKIQPTIASPFKMQLDELRTRVDSTMPHYIRCLKPNQSLMPNEFDKGMIANQLQNAGVLEAIRVTRVSYSKRFGHKVFVDRYHVIDVNNSGTIESLVDSITAMVKSHDGER